MSASIQALPVDLFHLLSTELSNRSDFQTLYSLAVSSKHLATSGAIAALYRISHQSPVKGGGSETLPLAEQELNVQRWSILWRTITLSAFGQTFYPYCRYMRSLDLRDLGNLLEDEKFRGKISKHFFTGPLAAFHFVMSVPTKRRIVRLDTKKIIAAIGNEVTKSATLLDSISEPTDSDVLSSVLPQWAPRLTNLRSLELWDGKVFADETVRTQLHLHCPQLSELRIYNNSINKDADHHLASFISGMPENSLHQFENIGDCHIGAETCLALNGHGKSLRTLKLALTEEGILALALLQGCTSLEKLNVDAIVGSADLQATQNDVFLEIVEWLKNCKSLQEISFDKFVSAPNLSLPVLLNGENNLESLEITGKETSMYIAKDNHDFHQALGEQTQLRQLVLQADSDLITMDDNEILINSFRSLKNLRTLKLTRISDFFGDDHINSLVQHLSDLEELVIGGYGISDAIWPNLAKLKCLKTVTFNGITTFTFQGVSEFVQGLGDEHSGLNLSIDNADPDSAISPEEQEQLREIMVDKINGRFEYQLLRDPNMPEFDSDDSD